MELIIINPCPKVRNRNPETRGRKAAMETLLRVMALEPDRLYFLTASSFELSPELAPRLGFLEVPHGQRVRVQLQTRNHAPDALLHRNQGKHRRIAAWWGQSLQNLISESNFRRCQMKIGSLKSKSEDDLSNFPNQ